MGLPGTNGTNGANGADGQLRIYGDGSAGARTIATSDTFNDSNWQYTDFTINPGVTLVIPSGVVIRAPARSQTLVTSLSRLPPAVA